MFNYRMMAILKREIRSLFYSKTFLSMTFLIPAFMFGIIYFQTVVLNYEGDEKTSLMIFSESQELLHKLESEFSQTNLVKKEGAFIQYGQKNFEKVNSYIKENKQAILDGALTGVVFLPDSALINKEIKYFSKNPNNNTLFRKISGTINKVLMNRYFADKNISEIDLSFAGEDVDFNGFRVTESDKVEEEGYGNMILAYLFSFLLYMSLLIIGSAVMRSVVAEKNNRIVEILLSSVNSRELMTGKILGNAFTGAVQMSIWLLPIFVLISTSWFVLPAELILSITPLQLLYFVFNYFLGLLTYLGLFAAVGAIFDNDQDAQGGMWPVMFLVMIPFFITFSLQNNPENELAKISSMVPFASIMVMPARMALIEVPAWQILTSFVVNILTIIGIFIVSGKIYKIGILITGKKPSWGEVLRWIRTS